MAALVPLPTKPYPNTYDMSRDEFEDSINRWVGEVGPIAEGMNDVAAEINSAAANVEALTASLSIIKWISKTYALGDVVWSPTDYFVYRCKTAGSRTIDPSLDPANWALQTKTTNGGSQTQTSAADIVLLSSSPRLQVISITTGSKKVTLPAATSLVLGSSIFVIRNSGNYRFAIRDNAANFLCYLNPGQVISLGLSDVSTSAGVWTLLGDKFDRIYDNAIATVLTDVAVQYIETTMLSATKGLIVYAHSADNYPQAVVFNSDGTYGTPVQITASACYSTSIAMLTATTALVVYQNINRHIFAQVLTITNNAIALGGSNTIHSVTGGVACLSLAMLSATKVLLGYHYTTGTFRQRLLTINSNAVTTSAEAVAESSASATGAVYFDVVKTISATKALSITDFGARWRFQDTSGATPVAGNALTISVFGATAWGFAVVILSTSRAVLVRDKQVSIIDISGTTPTLAGSKHLPLALFNDGAHMQATKLDSNRIFATWSGGYSLDTDGLIITITDSDDILFSPIQENISSMQDTSGKLISPEAIDSRFVMQVYRNQSTFLAAKKLEIN